MAYTKLSKSTYEYWRNRIDLPDPDAELKELVKSIKEEGRTIKTNPQDWGYRTIWGKVRTLGYKVNKKKIHRLVTELGLQSKSYAKRVRKYSSYRGKVGRIADNVINRDFSASNPHTKITTDTTEFRYHTISKNGNLQTNKVYLDVFLDLYNSEVISYSIAKTPSAKGILRAEKEAIEVTSDCKGTRIFHSDQGWAYQMNDYIKNLETNGICQSMSRKGNCLDNSVMENFFGIMKQEMYHRRTFRSYESLKKAITHYIDYYNNDRIKEKLNWLSPVQFRLANTN